MNSPHVSRHYVVAPDACERAVELLLKSEKKKAEGQLSSPDGRNAEERSKNGSSAKLSIP